MNERKQQIPMNRNRPTKSTTSTPDSHKVSIPQSIDPAPVVFRTSAGRVIEDYRRCPICWNGSHGYGSAYSTAPNGRTYYKCNQSLTEFPPCGHTWSVVVTLHSVTIEHKTVRLDGER